MPQDQLIRKTKRNRQATTDHIVNALEQVLAEHGLQGVSINLIAEKADVSKVLIYRYFGNLDGLMDYYLKRGSLIPVYSPTWIDQIQPADQKDLAPVWSMQTLQLFRQYRKSRAAREVLKATVKENDSLAESVSKSQDSELTRLVNQLAFIKEGDYQATSAVILGALSYLTIEAQLDRSVIGLDLRNEANWQRIEEAVKLIYKALNQSAIDSPTVQITTRSASLPVSTW